MCSACSAYPLFFYDYMIENSHNRGLHGAGSGPKPKSGTIFFHETRVRPDFHSLRAGDVSDVSAANGISNKSFDI